MTPQKTRAIPAAPLAPVLTRRKRQLFTLITALLPFLAIGILEVSLRLANYGGDLNLVVTREVAGQTYYAINRSVGKRYFTRRETVIPEPADDTFRMTKSSRTRRIFCLGESTMAGFPFEYTCTAPAFLRDRLASLFPDDTIEVVNAGLSAVGSFVVRDFAEELVAYQPDLFVVYVGHNEFYGVYGVASSVRFSGSAWLTRLTFGLLKFKSFLLLRNSYAAAVSWFARAPASSDETLMGQMVGNPEIPYGSEEYLSARHTYGKNIRSIIDAARSHGIPLLFCSLVSNVRTLPPFRSVPVDSLNAMAFYLKGQMLLRQGNLRDARTALVRAKDLDALRFRASEDFQDDLLSICRDEGVPVVRLDSAFAAQSPDGIIGAELLLEHVHPTTGGYFLMAKTICRAIAGAGLLMPRDAWTRAQEPADSVLYASSCTTVFDTLRGKITVEILRHHWPFSSSGGPYAYVPTTAQERIVYAYVSKHLWWSDARYRLAEYFAGNRRFEEARRECLAVASVIPYSYQPLLRVADYYKMEGRRLEADLWYRRCFAVEDNPYARMKLALLLIEEQTYPEAERQILHALDLDTDGRNPLPKNARSMSYYLLGVTRLHMNRRDEARSALERALAIDSGNREAQDLLHSLQQ